MLEKFRINRFCSCCTVKTGSLVIGVFGWIGSLLQAITLSQPTDYRQITQISSNSTELEVIEIESGPNVATIFLSIFMFGVSVALVIGVYQENRKYILPWLVIKFLECLAFIIATVVFFFMLFVSENVGIIFILFLIISGFTGLFCYCWICVWSLYMDLGEIATTIVPMGNNAYPMTENNMNMHHNMQNIPIQQHPPADDGDRSYNYKPQNAALEMV